MSAPRPAAADRGADVFTQALGQHRSALHAHCYRMLASFTDADDVLHEAAWRLDEARADLDDTDVTAQLFGLVTNTCLDAIRRRTRRITDIGEVADGPWLTPYPDRVLEASVTRDTIELPYITALQSLDARQRAVLLHRDALGWSAASTASTLELSPAAVTGALQRARAALRDLLPEPVTPDPATAEVEAELLGAYIDSYQNRSVTDLVALMREDVVLTMPPDPGRYDGIAEVSELCSAVLIGPGEWSGRPTAANRSPAAAFYRREPGDTQARISNFDVLRVVDGRIAEITSFGRALNDQFGFPEHL